jgi:hypothetical protein
VYGMTEDGKANEERGSTKTGELCLVSKSINRTRFPLGVVAKLQTTSSTRRVCRIEKTKQRLLNQPNVSMSPCHCKRARMEHTPSSEKPLHSVSMKIN